MSEADAELLHRLLGFYRQFAAENAKNARLRERIAAADQRAGSILVRLGQLTEAEQEFRQALEVLNSLLETDPHNIKFLVASGQIHNEIGELLLRRGQFHETFNAHLEALAMFLDQPESVLADPSLRYERARATDLFASIDIRSGTNQAPGGPPRGFNDRRPPEFDDRPPPRRPHDREPPRGCDDRRPPTRPDDEQQPRTPPSQQSDDPHERRL